MARRKRRIGWKDPKIRHIRTAERRIHTEAEAGDGDSIITEAGDFMITEAGDQLIT